ncbi:MAG: SUMF1/EgtB/PvdO family nonheme iron enzyme [Polyangiaceae bacterium]
MRTALAALGTALTLVGACQPPPPATEVPGRELPSAPPPPPAAPSPSAAASAKPAPAPAAKPRWASCETPPEDMVCIPGGPAVIGSDDGPEGERPKHEVEVSTFYLDRHEVTHAAYSACEDAGACPKRIPATPDFNKPNQPAVPITWTMAHAYCNWVGKRLPTEAEWEKAARGGPEGRRYPWGDEEPTCQRMQSVGCAPGTTLDVGSLPAGAYGLFDMAGNGYEWVQDWATPCYDGCPNACGEACRGLDPRGPCAGAPTCEGHSDRVLKGGSWFWPADQGRGAHRRHKPMQTGQHRYSVRCASTTPTLATWPAVGITTPLPEPPPTKTPSAAAKRAFEAVREDDDVLKIPPCKNVHEAQHDCRDPQSYLLTNEPAQELWRPYLLNRGGAYVGIGADQSYSFIGSARSRWAFIFDYDPAVIRLHYVLRALILAHEDPTSMVDAMRKENAEAVLALTTKSLEADIQAGRIPADEPERLGRELRMWLGGMHSRYDKRVRQPKPGKVGFDWLATPSHYRYVRSLYQQGRILLRKGNLLTDVALPDIATSARTLGIPIRVLYTSNADDQWTITEGYRKNLRDLPFDSRSIVLRTTIDSRRVGADRHEWDYVVHDGLDFQRAIARPELLRMRDLEQEGRNHDGTLITIALPGEAK